MAYKILRGGTGTVDVKEFSGLWNDTDQPFEIAKGYSTTANGRADDVVIPPGKTAMLYDAGDASNFAKWLVGEPEGYAMVSAKGTRYTMHGIKRVSSL